VAVAKGDRATASAYSSSSSAAMGDSRDLQSELPWKTLLQIQTEYYRAYLLQKARDNSVPLQRAFALFKLDPLERASRLHYFGERGQLSTVECMARAAAFENLNSICRKMCSSSSSSSSNSNSNSEMLTALWDQSATTSSSSSSFDVQTGTSSADSSLRRRGGGGTDTAALAAGASSTDATTSRAPLHWAEVVFACCVAIDAAAAQILLLNERVVQLRSVARPTGDIYAADSSATATAAASRAAASTTSFLLLASLDSGSKLGRDDLHMDSAWLTAGRWLGSILGPSREDQAKDNSRGGGGGGGGGVGIRLADKLKEAREASRHRLQEWQVSCKSSIAEECLKPAKLKAALTSVLSTLNIQAVVHAIESVTLILCVALHRDYTGKSHSAVPSVASSLSRLELAIAAYSDSVNASFVTHFQGEVLRYKRKDPRDNLPTEAHALLDCTQEALEKLVRGYRDVLQHCPLDGAIMLHLQKKF
jgi:hypothetical protein